MGWRPGEGGDTSPDARPSRLACSAMRCSATGIHRARANGVQRMPRVTKPAATISSGNHRRLAAQ